MTKVARRHDVWQVHRARNLLFGAKQLPADYIVAVVEVG
jgi:hypothetical protein